MAEPFHKVAIKRAYEPRRAATVCASWLIDCGRGACVRTLPTSISGAKTFPRVLGSASSTVIVLSASPSSRSATAPSCERRKRLPLSQK